MTGLEAVPVLLKIPTSGIASILSVVKAIRAGAEHFKATKEYEAVLPVLVRLLQELRLLAQAQIEASGIITDFEFFSARTEIASVTPSDVDRKFDRFNDHMVRQRGLASQWRDQIDSTRLHCGRVTEQAEKLDDLARRKNLKNMFGLLNTRVERLQELRDRLRAVSEDDEYVIVQYEDMASAVADAIEEIRTRLYLGKGDGVDRLKAANAELSARASEFRPINEDATEALGEIKSAIRTLEKSQPSGQ